MHNIRILPLILLTLTLWSCSSSEHDNPTTPQPDPQLVGIDFGSTSDAWQDAPTTRATDTGLETLFNSFRVWGYKTTDAGTTQTVVDGYHVSYDTDLAEWKYIGVDNPHLSAPQSIKYWDFAAQNYRFFGYSPFDATLTTATNADHTTITIPFDYSPDATATTTPYVSELWYSDNHTTTPRYGSSVKLTFAPLVAKVRFKFSYPDGTTSIEIKDIQFCDNRFDAAPTTADTPLSGAITATYALNGTPTANAPQTGWTTSLDDRKGHLVFTIPYESATDEIHVVDNEADYGKWYYVPPMTLIPYEQGAYSITALIDGNYARTSVPAQFMQWQPGYQYTYTFKITEAGTFITFTDLEVEKWVVGANVDNQGSGTEGW